MDRQGHTLLYVEAAAALAEANRLGRMDAVAHGRAGRLLDRLWAEMEVVEFDQPLADAAADMALDYALRGNDSVHCAAAAHLADPDLVAASGDQKQLIEWGKAGVATYDTTTP